MNQDYNPYQTPSGDLVASTEQFGQKAEAIIKDARQWWLAVLMCVLCTGWGILIIAPWYLARLNQWSRLAKAHPALLETDVPSGSLEQRFQKAKTQLKIGLSAGVIIFLLMTIGFTFLFMDEGPR